MVYFIPPYAENEPPHIHLNISMLESIHLSFLHFFSGESFNKRLRIYDDRLVYIMIIY